MACSYLNFSIQKIHQNSKNGGFYEYGANASKVVQKISTRTLLKSCQLTKIVNFKATPMKKSMFSSLLPAFWRYKPGFCFFPTIKND